MGAAFQPVPDTASITFRFDGTGLSQLQGCKAQFTFHVRDTTVSSWGVADLTTLADYGVDWWDAGKNAGSPFKDHFPDDWTLTDVVARNLKVAGGATVIRLSGVTGTSLGTPLPPNVAMLIRLRGDAGGEPPLGFAYMPATTEINCDGNNFTALHAGAVEQGVRDFLTDLNDPTAGGNINWAMVIVSRSEGTPAQLAAVQQARDDLRLAIAATRRATASTNTMDAVEARLEVSSQRDRRASQ